jgi:hypothetical protein
LELMAPEVTPFATPNYSVAPPPMPIATVDKPMPGKNQPKPTIDAFADLSPALPSPSTTISTASTSSMIMQMPSSDATTASLSSVLASVTASTGYLAMTTSSSTSFSISSASSLPFSEAQTTSGLSSLSQSSSFLTISRTEQAKEQLPSTLTSAPTPQALTMAPSLSSLAFSSLSLVAITTAPPSLSIPVSAEPQCGLTPLARSLFILFGVLGKSYVSNVRKPSLTLSRRYQYPYCSRRSLDDAEEQKARTFISATIVQRRA